MSGCAASSICDFPAPVTIEDLKEKFPPSGFVLVTHRGSEEIQYSIDADDLIEFKPGYSQMGKRLVTIPWCASVADVYEKLRATQRQVANVVNEHGETIGIITIDDIADAVFVDAPSRTRRITDEPPIQLLEDGVWHVMGLATLKRLEKQLQVVLPQRAASLFRECYRRFCRLFLKQVIIANGVRWKWRSLRLPSEGVVEWKSGFVISKLQTPDMMRTGADFMIWAIIVLLLLGLLLSAFFSGSETGFYRVTRVRLVLDGRDGDFVSRRLLWLTNNPSVFVATTLVGNNLANYLTSFAIVLASQLWYPAQNAEVLVSILFTPVVFVFGELLPKSTFNDSPNRLIRSIGPLFLVFVLLFAPIALVLWWFAKVLELMVGETPLRVQLTMARQSLQRVLQDGEIGRFADTRAKGSDQTSVCFW